MSNFVVCRICLVEDVRMQAVINTNLLEVYEKLTGMPFSTEDGRPLHICYICHARLQNCYRLQTTCRRSEDFLTEMLTNNWIRPKKFESFNTIKILHPLINFCCIPLTLGSGTNGGRNKEQLEEKSKVTVKEEDTERIQPSSQLEDAEVQFKDDFNEDIEDNTIKEDGSIHCAESEDVIETKEPDLIDEDQPNSIAFTEKEDKTTSINSEMDIDNKKLEEMQEKRVDIEKSQNKYDLAMESEGEYSCESNDDTYVPETSDKSDFDDEKSVTSKTDLKSKSKHRDTFDINNKGSQNALIHNPDKNFDEEVQKVPKKCTRQKDYCFFCEDLVSNFARHIFRHHSFEPEVQKITSMPKNSKSRKQILTTLRKKGNYINNTQNAMFKPMKKSKRNTSHDYSPCPKCLGFYSRKQLWKHKKLCNNADHKIVQADAQEFLIANIKLHKKLKDEIFSRMRTDIIAMYVKQDPLICAFGVHYLTRHKGKHSVNETSKKMRELGKLLIEIRKIKPYIKNLLDALKPLNYDTLVLAAKNAVVSDRYDLSSYAINIATSIKQCCNIALLNSHKSGAGINRLEIQTDLNTLISIIKSNWKFDVSNQNADDLNVIWHKKITIVSLATDLKRLNDHLNKTAVHAADILKEFNNSLNRNAFDKLVESMLCRVLLLNLNHFKELKRIKLSHYKKYDNVDNENVKFKKCDNLLSATERILTNSLKPIVILGRNGQGVPILFGKDVQQDIEYLISIRHKYVNVDNDSLFSKADGSILDCYETIEKYSNASGVSNPKALTSMRFRKYLTTLNRLFNMSATDMEKLASFLDGAMSIDKQNSGLNNDVIQIAKIAKFLRLIEIGDADIYKGRNCDEMNIDLDEVVIGDDIQNDDNIDVEISDTINKTIENPIEINQPNNQPTINPKTRTRPKKPTNNYESTRSSTNKLILNKPINNRRVLVPWTPEQKRIVLDYFSKHIKLRKAAKRDECEILRSKHPDLLHNKDWLKIKVFVQNAYKSK